ncbi:MAG TPA: hypothetical protein QF784_05945, partial [Prochlorococcaceae cyanobacterium Fu_MAG_134]|nr:hypothetical protein [Prochlorococcaceae cyanobacterium Fu_MAG_134]
SKGQSNAAASVNKTRPSVISAKRLSSSESTEILSQPRLLGPNIKPSKTNTSGPDIAVLANRLDSRQ